MDSRRQNRFSSIFLFIVALILAAIVVFAKISSESAGDETGSTSDAAKAETPPAEIKPVAGKAVKPEAETAAKPANDTVNTPAEAGKIDETAEENAADAAPDLIQASKNEDDIESSDIPNAKEETIVKDAADTDSEGYLHGKILPKKGIEEALLKIPGLQLKHAMEISNAIRYEVDLTQIKAGEDFKVKFDKEGNIDEFVYYPDIVTFHILKRDPAEKKLKYTAKILPTERRFRIIEGSIESSLNESLVKRDDVTRNIRAVTVGILECIVSFSTDARRGDKYRILVEDKYYRNQQVPGSKVLYASYEGKQAGFHEAFRYEDEDPKSAFNAHYTVGGKALIPSAMRLPLDTIRITSPFGVRRHPITGKMVKHQGVDYGAPVGTPVYAVAPGRVIEVKQTPLGGKQVTINHADNTKTFYLHLSTFHVSVGTVVSARQKIASVGNTGRSTGPHLHLGIKDPKGNWLNPLKIKMIATPQLDSRRMPRFKKQMAEITALLKNTEKYQEWLKAYDEGPQPGDFYDLYDKI
ncbi:peptidoglycan DD-metalloendopeptidase family protein [bacterium]|nr:peptidoglycan DD-metalloendopeptidase family protein [bacterium]